MMDTIEIRQLTHLNPDDLRRLVTGYTSSARYHVARAMSDQGFVFTLDLVPLPQPYLKRYEPADAQTLEHYRQLPPLGFSFGAYAGGVCIGLALAEPRQWNKSLWVWELHVAEAHRRHGIGQQLVEALARTGRAAGLRTLVCETQNTNVPAMNFYRKLGFELAGLDLTYYSNEDFPDGETALFMKRRLTTDH